LPPSWPSSRPATTSSTATAYKLEPNVKESPGGLRDIHTIGWVAKRHFGARTLHELVDHGFLEPDEYRLLIEGQEFLSEVRNGLHLLTGRKHDHLLFDQQRELASRFGYRDSDQTLAVEQFMKRYYRTVKGLSRLNEMLLAHFEEEILLARRSDRAIPLNSRFQIRKDFVEARDERVFTRYPFALLEIFLLLQQHRHHVRGVRAGTVRLIRRHLHLIDDAFRADIRCTSLFMEIIRQPHGIGHELQRMHRYGVLARYIPAFGRVVGQMQHDLFHVYTVDEHSLFVLRNTRSYAFPDEKIPALELGLPGVPAHSQAGACFTWERCFTISPRAVAGITRTWARTTRWSSAACTACRSWTPVWWPGWCVITC